MSKRQHAIEFTEPSLTQQHSKDEVDINNIMKRYIKTGVIDHVAKYEPQYGENTALDYHESMNIVAKANSMFEELPAVTRKEFDNDPEKFLRFVENPNNIEKLSEMGLTNTKPETMSPVSDEPPAPSPDKTGKTPSEPPSGSTDSSE